MGFYKSAKDFLNEAELYKLGELPTEIPHEKTKELSALAQNDIQKGIKVLLEVDVEALSLMLLKLEEVSRLRNDIKSTLSSGGKIYLCGCGATGRLSLALESIWRQLHPNNDQVIGFMAGGDVALVHSLEGFEDFPEYGARHLKQLNFSENDLLVSCTEGGETPYVIGATEAATQISKRNPYFLYCNPDEILNLKVKRSKKVLQNKQINKINLYVGPMALAGSTRMQASTVLQLAVGLALIEQNKSVEAWEYAIKQMIYLLKELDAKKLASFVFKESEHYKKGDFILYQVKDYGITVFTDTTERSPTFSLSPFQNTFNLKLEELSLSFVVMEDAKGKSEALLKLLNREPRSLNWDEITNETKDEYLRSFDFSASARAAREEKLKHYNKQQVVFSVSQKNEGISWKLEEEELIVPTSEFDLLFEHLLLKILLNAHSTLLMGRLGRFQSNIMTWVKPTNGKLIDRAARCVSYLLKHENIHIEYEQIVNELFNQFKKISPNEPVVLKTYNALLAKG